MGPAFAFWAGGFVAWIWRFGWTPLLEWTAWFGAQTWSTRFGPPAVAGLVIGVLAVIVASASLIAAFDLPLTQLLEGYWPRWLHFPRAILLKRLNRQVKDAEKQLAKLNIQPYDDLGSAQASQRDRLEEWLRRIPVDSRYRMPTRLGNILRSAERQPHAKYGLETLVCWPRLWLILPENVRRELTEARSRLDSAVHLCILGLLFILWTAWAFWALPVGLVVAFVAYIRACHAAEVYGDLLESAFDLYHLPLYEAMRWPTPNATDEEVRHGLDLTDYFYRGFVEPRVLYHRARKPSPASKGSREPRPAGTVRRINRGRAASTPQPPVSSLDGTSKVQ